MSDRGLSKVKILNFQDRNEIQAFASRYLDPTTSNFYEFLIASDKVEKEIKELDPEEIIMNKSIVQAFCKALSEVMEKALKDFVKDSDESLQRLEEFFDKTRTIFFNFLWIVRKVNGNVRIEKGIIGNIKSVMMWVLSKNVDGKMAQDFFVFLTVVYDVVLNMKKTGLKEVDLVQVSDMLIWLVDCFLCDKKYFPLSDLVFQFDNFRPAGIYHKENIPCDLIYYLLIGIENMLKVEISHLSDFVKNCLPNLLDYIYDIFQGSEGKNSITIELAIEKYMAVFRIFRMLCGYAKHEISKSFLKNNSDRIKNVFFYTLSNYIDFYFSCNSSHYDDDDGILGKIFKSLLEIISTIFIGSDQEGFPIIFCSVILQKVI